MSYRPATYMLEENGADQCSREMLREDRANKKSGASGSSQNPLFKKRKVEKDAARKRAAAGN